MSKPSVIFLGSKPGALIALNLLVSRGWKVEAVVSSGEGGHEFIQCEKLSTRAQELGIPVLAQNELGHLSADFVISYMFRNLVKSETRKLGKQAALNFHAGPLPEYGGWAFYNMAILENANEYGCTCHHMDDGFDTGEILKVRKFSINAQEETAWSLERRAQKEMINLFIDFMGLAESGAVIPKIPQDKQLMRYLTKNEFEKLKLISSDADAETIDRVARAFFYPPYECAYMLINENKVEVLPNIIKKELAVRLHCDAYQAILPSSLRMKHE
jgi:methionyl-tRNA formyltransferase